MKRNQMGWEQQKSSRQGRNRGGSTRIDGKLPELIVTEFCNNRSRLNRRPYLNFTIGIETCAKLQWKISDYIGLFLNRETGGVALGKTSREDDGKMLCAQGGSSKGSEGQLKRATVKFVTEDDVIARVVPERKGRSLYANVTIDWFENLLIIPQIGIDNPQNYDA
ncbi:MAG: hypothetical protein AAFP90_17915 [Planctomycetota bacterium]